MKSNVGHLEGASGLAAVIKAVLILEHGIIPPSANFERSNPRIDGDRLHIKVFKSRVDTTYVKALKRVHRYQLRQLCGRPKVFVEYL